MRRFAGIQHRFKKYGIDPTQEPLLVYPTQHYQNGGVAINVYGQSNVPFLYMAGEVAGGVHGHNRLGANSLVDIFVFGRRAGAAAARQAKSTPAAPQISGAALADAERELSVLLDRREGERPRAIRDELGATMHENFGVFREQAKMHRQLEIITGLRERYRRVLVEDRGNVFNSDLTQALELGFQLDLAACMVSAGVERKESRGAHSRPKDFPERDDVNFLRHSLVHRRDGRLELSWKPVEITKWQPEERSY